MKTTGIKRIASMAAALCMLFTSFGGTLGMAAFAEEPAAAASDAEQPGDTETPDEDGEACGEDEAPEEEAVANEAPMDELPVGNAVMNDNDGEETVEPHGFVIGSEAIETWDDVIKYINANGSSTSEFTVTVNGENGTDELTMPAKDKAKSLTLVKGEECSDGDVFIAGISKNISLSTTDLTLDGVNLYGDDDKKVDMTVTGRTLTLKNTYLGNIFNKLEGKGKAKLSVKQWAGLSGNITGFDIELNGRKPVNGLIDMTSDVEGEYAFLELFEGSISKSNLYMDFDSQLRINEGVAVTLTNLNSLAEGNITYANTYDEEKETWGGFDYIPVTVTGNITVTPVNIKHRDEETGDIIEVTEKQICIDFDNGESGYLPSVSSVMLIAKNNKTDVNTIKLGFWNTDYNWSYPVETARDPKTGAIYLAKAVFGLSKFYSPPDGNWEGWDDKGVDFGNFVSFNDAVEFINKNPDEKATFEIYLCETEITVDGALKFPKAKTCRSLNISAPWNGAEDRRGEAQLMFTGNISLTCDTRFEGTELISINKNGGSVKFSINGGKNRLELDKVKINAEGTKVTAGSLVLCDTAVNGSVTASSELVPVNSVIVGGSITASEIDMPEDTDSRLYFVSGGKNKITAGKGGFYGELSLCLISKYAYNEDEALKNAADLTANTEIGVYGCAEAYDGSTINVVNTSRGRVAQSGKKLIAVPDYSKLYMLFHEPENEEDFMYFQAWYLNFKDLASAMTSNAKIKDSPYPYMDYGIEVPAEVTDTLTFPAANAYESITFFANNEEGSVIYTAGDLKFTGPTEITGGVKVVKYKGDKTNVQPINITCAGKASECVISTNSVGGKVGNVTISDKDSSLEFVEGDITVSGKVTSKGAFRCWGITFDNAKIGALSTAVLKNNVLIMPAALGSKVKITALDPEITDWRIYISDSATFKSGYVLLAGIDEAGFNKAVFLDMSEKEYDFGSLKPTYEKGKVVLK